MISTDSIRISIVLPTSAERLYRAWLDSKEHGAFTRSHATIVAKVGGKVSMVDGTVIGSIVALDERHRILQSWRVKEFPEEVPDSQVEVLLEPASGGTRLTIHHTNLVPGTAGHVRLWWEQHYFGPMRRHFRAPPAPEADAPPRSSRRKPSPPDARVEPRSKRASRTTRARKA